MMSLRKKQLLEQLLPCVVWLRSYERHNLRGDVSAGLLVAVMLVPQAMAYSMLAGLPPVIGLYASTIPLFVYVLFGSSRQLAVGPVAMISLLVFASVSRFSEPGSQEYISYVLILTLMVGALQLAAGLLRLGFIVNFFSHAVISGFTSAAAILICLSQLKHLLGIKLATDQNAFRLLWTAANNLKDTNLITAVIGFFAILGLFVFKKKRPHFPAALLFVIAATIAVYFLGLKDQGVSVIGEVPKGLPSFSLPSVKIEVVRRLLPAAATIFLVGYMESISVAHHIAAKEKYRVDANQELRSLGLANIFSGLFSGYVVTGGFSRTAVNYQSGARSQLSSVITALIVATSLLLFAPLFYYLPNAVLGAVIVVAVLGLVDVQQARRLFRINRIDGWVLLLTFIATLSLGAEHGILMGVVFSLVIFIWRSAHPHIAELGYVEEEDIFRNLERFPKARVFLGVLILRVDASLYFANMQFLEDKLRRYTVERSNLRWIVFDLSGVNNMDAVAIDRLETAIEAYRERGIRFAFSSIKGPVRDLIARAGWDQRQGEPRMYHSLKHALQAIGISLLTATIENTSEEQGSHAD